MRNIRLFTEGLFNDYADNIETKHLFWGVCSSLNH